VLGNLQTLNGPTIDNKDKLLSHANSHQKEQINLSTRIQETLMSTAAIGATQLGDAPKKAAPVHKVEHKQMFDFRESLVIAAVVSILLLLFACLLLWLCNKTHQIVQDGDLEKGEKLFEEMLNPDYKEAFLNKKSGIFNKSDRKRYIIQKMKDDFRIKQEEERKQKKREEKKEED
jgi:di/tricarboxylate transporter